MVAWREARALVWAYDAKKIHQRIQQHARPLQKCKLLPESALYPPIADGVRLLQCKSGYEAQLWKAHDLVASRWWASIPDEAAWQNFQRDSGVNISEREPQTSVEVISLTTQPYFKIKPIEERDSISLSESFFYSLLILALGIPTEYQLTKNYQLQQTTERTKSELSQAKQDHSALLLARQTAIENATWLKAVAEIQDAPNQIKLLAAVANSLPNDGSFLKEWHFGEGELKFTVFSPYAAISSRDYVNSLQNHRLFNNIKPLSNPDPKLMTFITHIKAHTKEEANEKSTN